MYTGNVKNGAQKNETFITKKETFRNIYQR